MRGKGWLWLLALPVVVGLMGVSAVLGWYAARWQAGLEDFLCAGEFSNYRNTMALHDSSGIQVPADTRLRVRFCEYNAQVQLELLVDKSEFDQLQPVDDPTGGRWFYTLQPAAGDDAELAD